MTLRFRTFADLEQWLLDHQIETQTWGHDGTRSVADLWQELADAACELSDHPVCRHVRYVQVFIRSEDKALLEADPPQHDKRDCLCDRLPSTWLRAGEDPVDGARRCIAELLRIAQAQRIRIPAQEIPITRELTESGPYPGLVTLYRLYEVEVKVDGLPWGEFPSKETHSRASTPTASHRWQWVRWPQSSPDKRCTRATTFCIYAGDPLLWRRPRTRETAGKDSHTDAYPVEKRRHVLPPPRTVRNEAVAA